MNPSLRRFILASSLLALTLILPKAGATDSIPLRAGPLRMVFDTDNAFLRYINVGSHEVLRGINAPVRNQSWGTVKPRITKLEVEDKGDHFHLAFDVSCQDQDVDFSWRGTITGTSQGQVTFTFDGEAHSTFKRNRIGFCVLHGPSAAGQPWIIETVQGEKSEGRFPVPISPHQPAKNLRAMTHEIAPGLQARVEFAGDIFEMEDQRNWTDASFKTYCTPLEIPYPVEVPKGTKISQTIKFSIAGNPPDEEESHGQKIVLTVGQKRSPLPRFGLQVSSEAEDLSKVQLKRLKALNLDHLRVHLNLSADHLGARLHRAAEQAQALGVSLHVGLELGPKPAFSRLIEEVKRTKPPVSLWLVTGGNEDHYRQARIQLKPVQGKARIGMGWNGSFVDLNRGRPKDKSIQAVGYGINPQIHAFDNASIMETLPIQGDTVRSTRQFTGDRPLAIGPVTLRPQQYSQNRDPGQMPRDADIRQPNLFTAAWTLGSIKYLAEAGASSVTYYETVGWKGIMDVDKPRPNPGRFPSRPGGVFDAYHVLKDVGDFAGGQMQSMEASDTLKVVGVVLRKSGKMRLLVANLTNQEQLVSVRGLGRNVEVHLTDATRARAASRDPERLNARNGEAVMMELPIHLAPYGMARVDRVMD